MKPAHLLRLVVAASLTFVPAPVFAATKADYELLSKSSAQFGGYTKELAELAEQTTNAQQDHESALYLAQEAKLFFVESLLLSDHLVMYMLTDAGETRTQIRKILWGRLQDVDSQIETAQKVINAYLLKAKHPSLVSSGTSFAKDLKGYRETLKRIAKELGTKDAKW